MQDNRRILKEYEEIQKLTLGDFGVSAQMVGNDIRHWKGTIQGPQDTVYEGGTFYINIKIPPEYPYKPPEMKFITQIWHPNISSQTGAICLDILKNEWSPALTIRTALLSLQALLCNPEPNDPQDAEVASQYKNEYEKFKSTAKYWTLTYAKINEINEEKSIANLVEMGFTDEQAREALTTHNWDEAKALNMLLS